MSDIFYVTGDHPVLARPDKYNLQGEDAIRYADWLGSLGYENIQISKQEGTQLAKILRGDSMSLPRWMAGEVGVVLPNNFDKYQYFIELRPIIVGQDMPPFFKAGEWIARRFYFYANEIEVLEE